MSYGAPEWRPWVHDADASAPFLKRAIEDIAGTNAVSRSSDATKPSHVRI
jgi:hypothetical protein